MQLWCAIASWIACAQAISFSASIATELQPLFAPVVPWLGADCDTSIPLLDSAGNSTYLWIFADTLNGTLLPNGTRKLTSMPRNSLGLMQVSKAVPGPLVHYIRGDGGMSGAFFQPANKSQWFWPETGLVLPDGRLVIFASRMEQTGGGMWGFAQCAITLITVTSPIQSDPLTWTYTLTDLPGFSEDAKLGAAWPTAIAWGGEAGEYLYYLGRRANYSGFVGRILVSDLQGSRWEGFTFYAKTGDSSAYLPLPQEGILGLQLVNIFDDAAPETSLEYFPALKQWFTFFISFGSPVIHLRLAPAPEGPWSAPIAVFQMPLPYSDSKFFCYTPKSHPELAREGEILMTFACNGNEPDVLADTRIYVPVPVRIVVTP